MKTIRLLLGMIIIFFAMASLGLAQSMIPISPVASSPQLPGAQFRMDVNIGDSGHPVTNLFGVSFVLNYTNTNFVDVVGTPTAGGFLGNDIIFFPNVEDANGKVSIGMSRKGGQGGANGFGNVLQMTFTSLANTPNGTTVQFTITEIIATDANGASITLSPTSTIVTIGPVVQCPTVSGINPASGTVGTAVTITGTNLNDVAAVKFANNVSATFTIVSASQITTTVPSGAVTGPITISKTGCTDVQTGAFTVNALPVPIFPSASSPQSAGAEFEVEVKLGNNANPASNLFGLSFELNFSNTNFVDVVGTPTAGDFLGNDIIFIPIVDDANGKVSVGISRKAGQGGVNGNGTVMKVKFKTLATTPDGTQIQFTITNAMANDPNGASITLNPLPLTVTINAPILPVELVDFRANVSGTEVELTWRTASETDNYGFEVQRQAANDEFQKIGFVPGNGTSAKPHSYRFVDNILAAGAYDYRLKQIDRDGSFSYSSIVEAVTSIAPETFELRQNHPNPFFASASGTFGNPTTTIEFILGRTQPVRLSVYDVIGHEVAVLFNGQAEAGKFYRLEFDGAKQASGIYFYRLQSGERTQIRKMLLSK